MDTPTSTPADTPTGTPAGIVCGMGGEAVVELRAQDRRRAIVAAACDLGSVLLFVVLGRGSHGEGGSWLEETGKVAASFLIGVVVAWLVNRAWRTPWAIRTGVGVWAVTLVAGMALRPVFGRSVQVSFVIVTALFLALFMVGWRTGVELVRRRRTAG